MTLKAAREFSDTSRNKMADSGVAMPDGSYPIPDKDALRRAIQSYGRAKDPEAVKRHIIKRARALGATSLLPEDWGGAPEGKASVAALEAAQGACVLSEMYQVAACEADEPGQFSLLNQAIGLWTQWLEQERGEIGGPDDEETDDYDSDGMGKAAWGELKAEPMEGATLERWLSGQIPRRLLAIPFDGPIPSPHAPRGVDIDGEWFSERTDLYGGHKALLATRERLVDFHHGDDPIGIMGDGRFGSESVILGKAVIDPTPDIAGVWVDFWAKAGEKRLALVKALEERGSRLYGSSQASPDWRKNKATGEITVWPWVRQTISTSPQNTLAVMPALKALLAADLPFEEVGLAAVKAALVGLGDALQPKAPAAPAKPRAPRSDASELPVSREVLDGLRELQTLLR